MLRKRASAALLASIDALRKVLHPAVEHALAIESRPITIQLDGPSVEEVSSASSRRSSRSRASREPDAVIRLAAPPARSESAVSGRAPSVGARDHATARKAARSEAAETSVAPRVASTTPFDARDEPADVCSRCGSEISVVVREVSSAPPRRAESVVAAPTARLLLCDRCDSVRPDVEVLSRASSVQQRDPSPDPRPPAL